MRGALLNILFHPSGTHVNGHLDAVFVLLEAMSRPHAPPGTGRIFLPGCSPLLSRAHTTYVVPTPNLTTKPRMIVSSCQAFLH